LDRRSPVVRRSPLRPAGCDDPQARTCRQFHEVAFSVKLLGGYTLGQTRRSGSSADSTAAFDIPDLLWTVDDIWLSGQLAVNGVPIRKITDHEQANRACIRHFQREYGIWSG
jgi:hypothetical protein